MFIVWTPAQLGMFLVLAFTCLLLAGRPRWNPITESVVPILGAHYLVINTTCWYWVLESVSWEAGTQIFRFGLSPLLPSLSLYLGLLTLLAMALAVVSVWRSGLYASRQRWLFSVATLVLLAGVAGTAWTPIALQGILDAL